MSMSTRQIFHTRCMFLAAICWTIAVASAAAAEPPNLVLNGGFSQVQDGNPANCQTAGDAKDVTQTLSAARDADGRAVAKLACTRFDYRGGASHAMLAQVGGVRRSR